MDARCGPDLGPARDAAVDLPQCERLSSDQQHVARVLPRDRAHDRLVLERVLKLP